MKYVLAVLVMCLCLAGCWTPPTTSNVLNEYQGGLDDWTVGLDYQLWENVTSRVEFVPSQHQDAYELTDFEELTDAELDASALEADYSSFLTLGIWYPRMKKKNPKLLKPKK